MKVLIYESMAICNYLEKQSNNKEFVPQDEKNIGKYMH